MSETSNAVIWQKQDLRELPKFRDGTSYLYLEHTIVEKEDRSIQAFHPDGMISIPIASLSVLLLGPGSSVSHSAITAMSDTGCSVIWLGEQGVRFYASGTGESRSSKRLLRQAELWADESSRMQIVRQMYTMRFPEGLPPDLNLQQIRGKEGARVRTAYARYSKAHGVKWDERKYNRGNWDDADAINKAVSSGTSCLYGLAHAAILSCGYSPAIGFIHTGKQLSFVYDVADLYKPEVVLPIAFAEAERGPDDIESRVRHKMRDHIKKLRLLERMASDLLTLFDISSKDDPSSDQVGDLWDPDGNVGGGVNHARHDP